MDSQRNNMFCSTSKVGKVGKVRSPRAPGLVMISTWHLAHGLQKLNLGRVSWCVMCISWLSEGNSFDALIPQTQWSLLQARRHFKAWLPAWCQLWWSWCISPAAGFLHKMPQKTTTQVLQSLNGSMFNIEKSYQNMPKFGQSLPSPRDSTVNPQALVATWCNLTRAHSQSLVRANHVEAEMRPQALRKIHPFSTIIFPYIYRQYIHMSGKVAIIHSPQ